MSENHLMLAELVDVVVGACERFALGVKVLSDKLFRDCGEGEVVEGGVVQSAVKEVQVSAGTLSRFDHGHEHRHAESLFRLVVRSRRSAYVELLWTLAMISRRAACTRPALLGTLLAQLLHLLEQARNVEGILSGQCSSPI